MARRRRSAVHRTGGKAPIPPRLRAKGGRSSRKSAAREASSSSPPKKNYFFSRSPPPGDTGSALPDWFAKVLEIAQRRATARVEALRARFPEATRRGLGGRLVRGSALRAGLPGAGAGAPAPVTPPLGAPPGGAAAPL